MADGFTELTSGSASQWSYMWNQNVQTLLCSRKLNSFTCELARAYSCRVRLAIALDTQPCCRWRTTLATRPPALSTLLGQQVLPGYP